MFVDKDINDVLLHITADAVHENITSIMYRNNGIKKNNKINIYNN
jgi:hypothetical protein